MNMNFKMKILINKVIKIIMKINSKKNKKIIKIEKVINKSNYHILIKNQKPN